LFQVVGRLDRDKMSRGHIWRSSWSSRVIRPSRATRGSRGSSKRNVEDVSDSLRVLVAGSQGWFSISSSFCESPCNSLHRCNGLSRYDVAIKCVCGLTYSNGCSEFNTSGTVWASWATWIDNCWCISDLKVGEVCCKVFCIILCWWG